MGTNTIYTTHAPVFVLWASRETGVLTALREGMTDPDRIATDTGITERAAEIVLPALADLGYVVAVDGTYQPTDQLTNLDPDTPLDERGILPHRLDVLENYCQLPEIMETGEYPEFTEQGLENYVGGMASIDPLIVREAVTTAERAHPRPDSVLDVGGGIGRFAREFERRGANVTLLDEPPVIELVEPNLADTEIELHGGDAVESLPSGYSLAFCGRLTVSCSPTENEQLFENLYAALEPGGTAMCLDFVQDRSENGTMFGVHMLALSPTGNTYSEAQYCQWLTDAGFVDCEIRDVPGTAFQAIIGHRPG